MLLFDENLAARLVIELADIYPGCTHVGDRGLAGGADRAIWQYARDGDFVIVTKDEDFQRLSVLFGAPPKVIWVQLGLLNGRYHPVAAQSPRGGQSLSRRRGIRLSRARVNTAVPRGDGS